MLQTDYQYRDSLYILDNRDLTLTCRFDVTALEVNWAVDGSTIYFYSFGTVTKQDTEYKDHIKDYSYNDTEHRLTLTVDRDKDLGRKVTCNVRISIVEFEEDEYTLQEIFGKDVIPQHFIEINKTSN